MGAWTDMAFILVVVLDLFLLASSRLGAAIRAVALQGALLSLLALLLTSSAPRNTDVTLCSSRTSPMRNSSGSPRALRSRMPTTLPRSTSAAEPSRA